MIKLLKEYVSEIKRANDLKERELDYLYTPGGGITVHIPQLNNIELRAPDTNNPCWSVFSSGTRGWDTHTKLES